jgi:hypothetical protein
VSDDAVSADAVSAWLSSLWFEGARDLAGDQMIGFGVTGSVQCEITGGPDGDVTGHLVLEDGRLNGAGVGPIDQPDVVVTMVWADAASMQRGELDPNVAFMQGRLKVAGSMDVMLDLLKWVRTPDGEALIGRIAEATQF